MSTEEDCKQTLSYCQSSSLACIHLDIVNIGWYSAKEDARSTQLMLKYNDILLQEVQKTKSLASTQNLLLGQLASTTTFLLLLLL